MGGIRIPPFLLSRFETVLECQPQLHVHPAVVDRPRATESALQRKRLAKQRRAQARFGSREVLAIQQIPRRHRKSQVEASAGVVTAAEHAAGTTGSAAAAASTHS